MLLNIQRTGADDYGRHIKALICGAPGSGKTLISSTFPNPLYLSTEGLMMSVADRDVPFHKLTSSDALKAVRNLLELDPKERAKSFGFPVDTIVIDTIDDVSRMLLRERMAQQKHDNAELSDYGWLKGQLALIVTALRNLDMNVVLTCHLKAREVTGLATMIPAIEGGFAGEVAQYVDLAVVLKSRLVTKVVGHDTVRDVERYMQTIPDAQHDWIKDHSYKLPQEFPLNFTDDYDRLVALIYGDPKPAKKPERPPVESAPKAAPSTAPLDPDKTWFTCDSCTDTFDDEELRDRGQIRYSQTLCLACLDAKAQKKTA